jgi:hypothetical protein
MPLELLPPPPLDDDVLPPPLVLVAPVLVLNVVTDPMPEKKGVAETRT